MIIRKEVLKTLKASPLNNRSVRRTCGQMVTVESTLKECPFGEDGATLSESVQYAFSLRGLRTTRFLDEPSEQVRVLSGDASSVKVT